MPVNTAFREAVRVIIEKYESGFVNTSKETLALEGSAYRDASWKDAITGSFEIPFERLCQIVKLKSWLQDESLSDIKIRALIAHMVEHTMQSGFSIGFATVDMLPDKLVSGLRALLANPCFSTAKLKEAAGALPSDTNIGELIKAKREALDARITQLDATIRLFDTRAQKAFLLTRSYSRELNLIPPKRLGQGPSAGGSDEPGMASRLGAAMDAAGTAAKTAANGVYYTGLGLYQVGKFGVNSAKFAASVASTVAGASGGNYAPETNPSNTTTPRSSQ